MDRVFEITAVALITAGLVILGDVAATLAWQEPTSSLYASIQQGRADDQLDELRDSFPGPADLRAARRAEDARAQARVLAGRFADQASDGEAIGRLVIESIDLDMAVVQGTDSADLVKGPGHYTSTPLPGQPGTTGIAGHRTTYLAPFRHLDALNAGDAIRIEMPYAAFRYRVEGTKIVEPTNLGVLRRVGYQRLVLTACHPLYSAAQRIVAFARLERVRPLGLAAAPPG